MGWYVVRENFWLLVVINLKTWRYIKNCQCFRRSGMTCVGSKERSSWNNSGISSWFAQWQWTEVEVCLWILNLQGEHSVQRWEHGNPARPGVADVDETNDRMTRWKLKKWQRASAEAELTAQTMQAMKEAAAGSAKPVRYVCTYIEMFVIKCLKIRLSSNARLTQYYRLSMQRNMGSHLRPE